ncbi:MAG: Bax inhibitor-1/YccA family protein [Peptococcaceae bacterium]|nr:Bax inhibitor-1/YccA family protein [Peptococcaceae bacterium]
MEDYALQYGEGDSSLMSKVLFKFSISLLLMTVGMVVGALFIPPALASMMPILCLGMLLIAFFARWMQSRRTGEAAAGLSMGFVYVFAALEGVGLYPIVMYYTQTIGANLVLGAGAVTFVLFFGLAIYARKTSRNFLAIGPMLFFGLIALILASIVGLFVQATMLQIAICAGGVFIFSGYVLYDIQTMRTGLMTEDDVPMLVLSLFLDFINLFIYILRLFGFAAAGRD